MSGVYTVLASALSAGTRSIETGQASFVKPDAGCLARVALRNCDVLVRFVDPPFRETGCWLNQ